MRRFLETGFCFVEVDGCIVRRFLETGVCFVQVDGCIVRRFLETGVCFVQVHRWLHSAPLFGNWFLFC